MLKKRRGVETGLKVREVMSKQVVTAKEEDNVQDIAKLMKDKSLGSIIIVDDKGNPTGIVTDRDIVMRIVAKNILPSQLKSKDVMSTPVNIVGPDMDVGEAVKMMNERRIRRLLVMNEGKIVGLITDRAIFQIMPELMDIVAEKARITSEVVREPPLLAGYCDNCGQWSDKLREVEGKLLCEDCSVEMETEEQE
ncbi:MAG TPA: CBS domain-containing protein [archaeon]|nr:CBS domain-containing protein [archaeon]